MSGEPLSERLRRATAARHRAAERSGIMPRLLAGRLERARYAALLRNLHALYAALEDGLDRHAGSPLVAPVRFPALYRAPALGRDLAVLWGAEWRGLPLCAAMADYVARLSAIAGEAPGLLAAHAYVRYLGDLSGGQVLRNVVARAFGLRDGAGVAFYSFDAEPPAAAKARLRAGLDALPLDAAGADALVAEALDAFERHIALFVELDRLPQRGA
jgi:heme oxygenase